MKFEIEKNFMKGSYIVCCNGIEEVVNIQKILFLNEIYWHSRKEFIEEDVWLRISDGYIQAYGEKEKYLSGYYDHIDLSGYTFINANKLMRKLKLKKISNESSMCKE